MGLFHYLHRPSTLGRKLFFDGAFYFEMHIAPVYLNCNEHKTYIYIYICIWPKLGVPFLSSTCSSSLAKLYKSACIKTACFSSVIWKRKKHLIFLHCLSRKREAIWLMNSLVFCWWLKNATGKGKEDMIQPRLNAVIVLSWVKFICFLVFKICL